MRFVGCSFLCVLLLVMSILPAGAADRFTALAGLNPPFCINKGLHLEGVAVDAFEVVMKSTGTPFNRKNIKLMPWKQACADAAAKPGHVMINMVRTPDVEDKYKWVGPIHFPRYVLIGKKGKEYEINSPDDAEKYSVALIRGSGPAKALVEEGVDPAKLKASASYVQPLLQLKNSQVDLMAHSDLAAAYLMQKMRMDTDDYTIVYMYKKVPLYFAFSKDTDDAYIELLNKALASYKVSTAGGDSAYGKNLRKYVPDGGFE